MGIITINGIDYVERNYENVRYAKWSPEAFVIGVVMGFTVSAVMTWVVMYIKYVA